MAKEAVLTLVEKQPPIDFGWLEFVSSARRLAEGIDPKTIGRWIDQLPQIPERLKTLLSPGRVDIFTLREAFQKRGLPETEAHDEAVLFSTAKGETCFSASEVLASLRRRIATLTRLRVLSPDSGLILQDLLLAQDQQRVASDSLKILDQIETESGGTSPQRPPDEREEEKRRLLRKGLVAGSLVVLALSTLCVPASYTVTLVTRLGESGYRGVKKLTTMGDEEYQAVLRLEEGLPFEEAQTLEAFYTSGISHGKIFSREFAPGTLEHMNQQLTPENGLSPEENAWAWGLTKAWRENFFVNGRFDESLFIAKAKELGYFKTHEEGIRIFLRKYKEFLRIEKVEKPESRVDYVERVTTAQRLLKNTQLSNILDAQTIIGIADTFPPGTTRTEMVKAVPKIFPDLPPIQFTGESSMLMIAICLGYLTRESPRVFKWAKAQLKKLKKI